MRETERWLQLVHWSAESARFRFCTVTKTQSYSAEAATGAWVCRVGDADDGVFNSVELSWACAAVHAPALLCAIGTKSMELALALQRSCSAPKVAAP